MNKRIIRSGVKVLLFFFASLLPAYGLGPSDTVAPGQWVEVPSSTLATVFPTPWPPGATGPSAVMSAWSGGAYDTLRNRLIVHGGGHGDYAGNEIYVFDINAVTWTRVWGPTPNSQIQSGTQPPITETYLDGNPRAVHTYSGLVYLPIQNKLWRGGGSIWSGSGQGSRTAWYFDFTSLSWLARSGSTSLGVSQASAYDPVTGHIFGFSDQGRMMEYDPITDAWMLRAAVYGLPVSDEMMAVADPQARLFIAIGGGRIIVHDLAHNTTRAQITTGPQRIVTAKGPGLAYDSVVKTIVGWGGGSSMYSLNTTTWVWTEHTVAPTNTVTPPSFTTNGVYGRFAYIPIKNAYIVVTSTGSNVFFYRLPLGTIQPPRPLGAPFNLQVLTP